MSEKKFLSMSHLSESIQERVKNLESGKLPSEELENLSNDIRDLYERMVILRYKALEKGIKINSTETPKEFKPVIEHQVSHAVKTTESPLPKEKTEDTSAKISTSKKEEIVIPSFKFSTQVEPKQEIKKEEPKAESVKSVTQQNIQSAIFDAGHDTLENKKEISINEKLAQEKSTSIAEKYATDQKFTLAEKLKMTRINDLRSAIGINQKFLFMNDLFEGENTAFNDAISRLNSCNNGDEAHQILHEYAQKYQWSNDGERVQQFTELIVRRYL